ncbi:hypothetical protein CQ017_17545 [Arthrobacter sp. MYb224]|nr:hypothetical protein CQ017_17545 [Arthrobacter sp. MYb224]
MPVFPEQFGSLAHARDCMGRFAHMYGTEHRHSGLGIYTPADVHSGMIRHMDVQRLAALDRHGRSILSGLG